MPRVAPPVHPAFELPDTDAPLRQRLAEAVVDTVRDEDLIAIGEAAADLPLITGGSGIALGLPANFRARGEIAAHTTIWDGIDGAAVIVSGSCSTATRAHSCCRASRSRAPAISRWVRRATRRNRRR